MAGAGSVPYYNTSATLASTEERDRVHQCA